MDTSNEQLEMGHNPNSTEERMNFLNDMLSRNIDHFLNEILEQLEAM